MTINGGFIYSVNCFFCKRNYKKNNLIPNVNKKIVFAASSTYHLVNNSTILFKCLTISIIMKKNIDLLF